MAEPVSLQATADVELPKTVITKKDRQFQLWKLFVIVIVSVATVGLTIVDVLQTANEFKKKTNLIGKIRGSINTAYVIHNLQKERGLTALQFGFQQLNFDEQRLKLRDIRRATNASIDALEKRDDIDLSVLTGGTTSFWNALQDFRSKIDNGQTNVFDHLHTYRKWVSTLISTLANYTKSENLEDYANLVYAYELMILSKEEAGMERALGGLKFIQGNNFSIINTTWYNKKCILSQSYLETAFLFSPELKEIYFTLLINNTDLINDIEEKRKILLSGSQIKSSDDTAYEWFELMTKYNKLMLELQKRQANLIEAKVKNEIHQSTNELVIRSLLLCFALIVVPCIVVSLALVQKRFYDYTLSLFDKVGLEQARTDFLMRENARHVDTLADRWRRHTQNSLSDVGGINHGHNIIKIDQ